MSPKMDSFNKSSNNIMEVLCTCGNSVGETDSICDGCQVFFCETCAENGLLVSDEEWLCEECVIKFTDPDELQTFGQNLSQNGLINKSFLLL